MPACLIYQINSSLSSAIRENSIGALLDKTSKRFLLACSCCLAEDGADAHSELSYISSLAGISLISTPALNKHFMTSTCPAAATQQRAEQLLIISKNIVSYCTLFPGRIWTYIFNTPWLLRSPALVSLLLDFAADVLAMEIYPLGGAGVRP